jgi:hypothetical protein
MNAQSFLIGRSAAALVAAVVAGWSASSRAGAAEFLPPADFPTAVQPYGLAAADFNGDGLPDLAVVCAGAWNTGAGGNVMTVFTNSGNGSLDGGISYATGVFPVAVTAADLNHDGAPDLVVTNRQPNAPIDNSHLSLFLNRNDGSGTFHAPASIPSGRQPMHTVVGLFNADPHPDLAVAVHGSWAIQILIGNGDGTFAEPLPRISLGPDDYEPQGLATGDFNGDGNTDLVATLWFRSEVRILTGNGNGSFNLGATLPVGSRPGAAVVSDLDHDGASDLIVADTLDRTISILRGTGGGNFLPRSFFSVAVEAYKLAFGDIDLDGTSDLIFANSGLRIFRGLGGTGFDTPWVLPDSSPAFPEAVVADFNKDGAPDIAFTRSNSNKVSISLQIAPPNPRPLGTHFLMLPPVPEIEEAGDQYQGLGLAMDGQRVAVGAPFERDSADRVVGAVRIYERESGRLLHFIPGDLTGFNVAGFGHALAIRDNLLAVGAHYTDIGDSIRAGLVTLHDLSLPDPSNPVRIIPNPQPLNSALFGSSLSILAGGKILVGTPFESANAGRLYLFDSSSDTPAVPVMTFMPPAPDVIGFGVSQAAWEETVVVGALNGAWVMDPINPGNVIELLDPSSQGVSSYFGFSVARHGNRVVVGAPHSSTTAPMTGLVYEYDLGAAEPGTAIRTYQKPEPAEEKDMFGMTVALSEAGFAVGCPYTKTPETDSGTVYLFHDPLPVRIFRSPVAGQAAFGRALALDATRMLAGAPLASTYAGAAFVFDPATPTTTPLARLDRGVPNAGGHFGAAVAVAGNLVMVGAPDDDDEDLENSGRLFIHDLGAATPESPRWIIPNPEPQTNARFGHALAASGDRVVAGAPGTDDGATGSGKTHVFDLGLADPTAPVISLSNPTPGAGDAFGSAVAINGSRLVVGAPFDSGTYPETGIVYVFDLDSSTPTQPTHVLTSDGAPHERNFGRAVAISGTRVLVTGGTQTDARVFLFDLNLPPPHGRVVLTRPPGLSPESRFGEALSASGEHAMIGAPEDASGGKAFLYSLLFPTGPVQTFHNPEPWPGDLFGRSVAIRGNRIVIGCPGDGPAMDEARNAFVAVYAPVSPGDSWQGPILQVASLANPRPATLDRFGAGFGMSVAADGPVIAIGAPNDPSLTTEAGSVHGFIVPQIVIDSQLPQSAEGWDFGAHAPGSPVASQFGIRNLGDDGIEILSLATAGDASADFIVEPPSSTAVPAGGRVEFTITFTASTAGTRQATLEVAVDDSFGSSMKSPLTGRGLSRFEDSDQDGLNDVAEYHLAGLGFQWNIYQPHLVDLLFQHAETAGFYQESAVGSLYLACPGIHQDPATGRITLTSRLGFRDPSGAWVPHPLAPDAVQVTPSGAIEATVDSQGAEVFLNVRPE